jgi:hypothetical protein
MESYCVKLYCNTLFSYFSVSMSSKYMAVEKSATFSYILILTVGRVSNSRRLAPASERHLCLLPTSYQVC